MLHLLRLLPFLWGLFTLENVPPGTYTLQVWHERLGVAKKELFVSDGMTTVTVEMVRQ